MSATTTNVKEAIINRRSIRKVKKNDNISKERINELLKIAFHAPTSFNMQSGRVVVVMDDQHERFWDIVKETFVPVSRKRALQLLWNDCKDFVMEWEPFYSLKIKKR